MSIEGAFRRLQSSPLDSPGTNSASDAASPRAKSHKSLWHQIKRKLAPAKTQSSSNLSYLGRQARANSGVAVPTESVAAPRLCASPLLPTSNLAPNSWLLESAPCHLSTPQSPVAVSATVCTIGPITTQQDRQIDAPAGGRQAWPLSSDFVPLVNGSLDNSPPSGSSTPLSKFAGGPLARLVAASKPHAAAPQRALSQDSAGLCASETSEQPVSALLLPDARAEAPVVPAPAPATAAAAQSKLLAVSPALPSAMSRLVWSLEDYSISRRLYKGSSSSVYKVCWRRKSCGFSGRAFAVLCCFCISSPASTTLPGVL